MKIELRCNEVAQAVVEMVNSRFPDMAIGTDDVVFVGKAGVLEITAIVEAVEMPDLKEPAQ